MDELLTTRELSELLKVSEQTIKIWARSGRVPALKVGAVWRFEKGAVLEVFRKAQVNKPE
jgi:excisionase family DNA binding protein